MPRSDVVVVGDTGEDRGVPSVGGRTRKYLNRVQR